MARIKQTARLVKPNVPRSTMSTAHPTATQRTQKLDPSENRHSLALRAFRDLSRRKAKTSCQKCSDMGVPCFVAPVISPKCVNCLACGASESTHYVCLPGMLDGKIEGGEDDLVVIASRRQMKDGSRTTPAVTGTTKSYVDKAKNVRGNRYKAIETFMSPSADVPHRNATRESESSAVRQESRSSVQTKPLDKPSTPTSSGLKRKCSVFDITAEAAHEATQTYSSAGRSSAQSRLFSTLPTTSSKSSGQPSMRKIRLASNPRMNIDAHKQNSTTLWVSLPSSSDAVPLKLRSCKTMSSLFDSVLTICGLVEQQDKVLGLRITPGCMRNVGVNNSMMLKRQFEDSFEVFLDIIDAAHCWEKEGGRYHVAVEVVMS